ncbi:MAG: hypothetical protein J6T22_09370 [Bacteroidales bacterium]|nr:hypothetical protein [Bacteroidales bacterium]MBO7617403.1 hypothetical protein [Bacteroidales bacterium]
MDKGYSTQEDYELWLRIKDNPDYDLDGLPPDHPARKDRAEFRKKWAKLMAKNQKKYIKELTEKIKRESEDRGLLTAYTQWLKVYGVLPKDFETEHTVNNFLKVHEIEKRRAK